MKKLIVTCALVLSLIFTLGLASDALAGRAAALLAGTPDGSALVLIDFDETDFSQTEAQRLMTLLQTAVPILQQLLAGQAPGVSLNVTVFTPSQMSGFGLGDADTANNFIIQNMSVFSSIGVQAYLKAVATKVNAPQGITGQNIRLDLYFLIIGSSSSLEYVGALEVREQLIQQLSGFLPFLQ